MLPGQFLDRFRRCVKIVSINSTISRNLSNFSIGTSEACHNSMNRYSVSHSRRNIQQMKILWTFAQIRLVALMGFFPHNLRQSSVFGKSITNSKMKEE